MKQTHVLMILLCLLTLLPAAVMAQTAPGGPADTGCQDSAGGPIPCPTETPREEPQPQPPPAEQPREETQPVPEEVEAPDETGRTANPLRPSAEGACQIATASTAPTNLRAEPSLAAAVVGTLDPNILYDVLGMVVNNEGLWYGVGQGWASGSAVVLDGRCPLRVTIEETEELVDSFLIALDDMPERDDRERFLNLLEEENGLLDRFVIGDNGSVCIDMTPTNTWEGCRPTTPLVLQPAPPRPPVFEVLFSPRPDEEINPVAWTCDSTSDGQGVYCSCQTSSSCMKLAPLCTTTPICFFDECWCGVGSNYDD